ncbi:DUF2793 domain-containing protein [Paracoccus aminophilus]|uniref:DUF2793 domain-containing protein n=1 Tax=Paracoccus aminophilus JCM 7686 TaxID=1367847 RepID=S5XRK1_PARAH|nr:DUF2793 domain-containing protein [Paracoccus aminophilus]AGT07717.1 hypothetical protein JCM7686_0608 [Paracoccus aminophilus JCM 7686]
MSENETSNLALPLLLPAQAQKHVTVNDALLRLDGMVDLVLQSLSRTQPPAGVVDGMCWGVPPGAVNAWEGRGGQIAIGANGGWVFVTPRLGSRAYIADQGVPAIHDGALWVPGALNMGAFGSGLIAMQASDEVTLTAGASKEATLSIPAGVMVIGVTARVTQALTGTLTSWRLGTAGAENRFGDGLGKGLGSWGRGILSQPMTYWDAAPLRLTATGGNFAAGKVRLVAHWLELRIPN